MSVRLMQETGDVGEAECRLCDQRMLYTDHFGHVWCADCEGWNGWWAGPFWAQPGVIPAHSPNGVQTTLF